MSKWWDIESYASNSDVIKHSKEEERENKTLEQTKRFNGERYEVVASGRSEVTEKLLLCNGANYALHQVAKDNAVNNEGAVRTVQRNFYMDDFLKSVRTPQEAIKIYQKIRDILSKGGFNLTKWITSDDEVESQIPEKDRSTKVVKTFEAEPQSSSILGLNWNVDTESPIVCRGTEQEVPTKITQRIVLSFVSAVFDPLGICSPFTIRMRFLLKSILAAMGQAWDKELSAEHLKLFSGWCSELREIRAM